MSFETLTCRGRLRSPHGKTIVILLLAACVSICAARPQALAQLPEPKIGEVVPRDVREMYDRGLQFLANSQTANGDWDDPQKGPAITGLALMAFLASGEDPNFGLYSNHVRKAVRSIISGQDAATGYYGNSMYHHGFAMLAMAEAYGTVDDRNLWADAPAGKRRSIGQSLELAARAAITSQKRNSVGGWRYSPESTDADTSVSGAVLVGLLAARNAGIEVPDESIDRAVAYYQSMTANSGQVGYSGGLGGFDESIPRISIATLVYSLAHRKDLPQFKATLGYLTQRIDQGTNGGYAEYQKYYQAQALFQGDVDAWEKWNRQLVRELKQAQLNDGGWNGQFGKVFGTSMSLLSLALNYRFLPIYER
jgi:hypothetical protein